MMKLTKEKDKFAVFEDWLRENNAEFSLLELRSYDDNLNRTGRDTNENEEEKKADSFVENLHMESEMRGVHAKTDIPADTICVKVPRKCLITVEMGQATDIGQLILQSNLDLDAPKHIFLMIYLLWDINVNGDKSFFKPYYDILPKTLKNMPIFWDDHELHYLKGSFLLKQIEERIDAITEDYELICQVAPQLKEIASLEEFKWARMVVCSRNFGLEIDGHRTSALVPHADMLNHHRPRETKWCFDDDSDSFIITTLKPIPAFSQVFDSYGQKCNHRFLLNYGFAVENNREPDGFCPNEVPIELTLTTDDELYEYRYDIWTRSDIGSIRNCLHSAVISAAVHSQSTGAESQPIHEALADALNQHVTTFKRGFRSYSVSSDDSSLELTKRIRVSVSNNENTKHLFSMLRVLVANKDELMTMVNSPSVPFGDTGSSIYFSRAFSSFNLIKENADGQLGFQQAIRTCRDIRYPISLRNEKAAMELLLRIVSSALDEYNCTLTQDISDLMNEELYPKYSNKRNAKIQVRGEKEVLQFFLDWAKTALNTIEIIDQDIRQEKERLSSNLNSRFDLFAKSMEENEFVHFNILRYCTDILGSLHTNAIQSIRHQLR